MKNLTKLGLVGALAVTSLVGLVKIPYYQYMNQDVNVRVISQTRDQEDENFVGDEETDYVIRIKAPRKLIDYIDPNRKRALSYDTIAIVDGNNLIGNGIKGNFVKRKDILYTNNLNLLYSRSSSVDADYELVEEGFYVSVDGSGYRRQKFDLFFDENQLNRYIRGKKFEIYLHAFKCIFDN